MLLTVVVLAAAACASAAAVPAVRKFAAASSSRARAAGGKPHHRLLEFNEHTRVWVHEDEVAKLIAQPVHNFIDVTDNADVGRTLPRPPHVPLPPMKPAATLRALASKIDPDRIVETVVHLSESYDPPTRYYRADNGQAAAQWLAEQYTAAAQAEHLQVRVELFPHARWTQDSVRVVVECALPEDQCNDEVLVLGGHIDSVTSSTAFTNAPGADDDASGSACVLEAFRVLAAEDSAWRPNRRVEFHGYAAEEAGLLGSQEIVQAFQRNATAVLAMMQLDMTGYQNGAPALIRDFTNDAVTDRIAAIGDAIGFTFINSNCGYGCSDHASWHRAGYAAAFPFEAAFNKINPAIHTVNDKIDKITAKHMEGFAQVATTWVYDLSSEI